ncbi:hypothetical protein C2845_PM09G15570 [Panicum miliaceum]|uniref:Uncharacterized protein n=1 Tax=Panicum miliaceum TaxID=4540 RepID=A0A3L6S451_PANMI|nr:hypothetical protein C2845_PM09G15570 [Panicum miliaceum]
MVIAFVGFSYLNLVLLFCCLRWFERAAPGSAARGKCHSGRAPLAGAPGPAPPAARSRPSAPSCISSSRPSADRPVLCGGGMREQGENKVPVRCA